MSIKCLAWAWGKKLPPLPKLILLAIADHADDTGYAWPGIKGVAEKCGLSRRTVQRHLNVLIDKDIITVKPRTRPDGSATSNSYQVNMEGASACHPPASESHPPVSVVTPPHVNSDTPLTVIEPSMNLTTTIQGDTIAKSLADALPKVMASVRPPLPEWFQVLYDIEPVEEKDVTRIMNWAEPHNATSLREVAYVLAGKWEEYRGIRTSIYPTFQNWVNRDEKNPTGSTSKKHKKSRNDLGSLGGSLGLPNRADYEVEAYIQAQGLHPASEEAAEIRKNGIIK